MEDGAPDTPLHTEMPVGDGVASPTMANSPEGTSVTETSPKLNGDTNNQTDYSSESDALVIDEGVPKSKRKDKKDTCGNPRNFSSPQHFNPYFHESIVELSRQHHQLPSEKVRLGLKQRRGFNKAKNSPKLREYAQYLGLQPTVQFKCSKCNRAGFESLSILNQHIVRCTEDPLTEDQRAPAHQSPETSSSSFKLTRKVFLCSACGTYYENWNLYLHMLEVHRRYLCLYCLGMFSVLDELCLHIQTRHNFEPGHKDTPDDFFDAYSEPCYIVCCDCGLPFNEQDNFFYHTCVTKENQKNNNNNNNHCKSNKQAKIQIRPENHVTGDSSNQIIITDNCNDKAVTNHEIQSVCTDDSNNQGIGITEEARRKIDDTTVLNEGVSFESDSEPDLKGFDTSGKPVFVSDKGQEIDFGLEEGEEEEEEEEEEQEHEEEIDQEEAEEIVDEIMEEDEKVEELVETRKVPKLSLKLKLGSFPKIDQSSYNVVDTNGDDGDNKIRNDFERIESENEGNITSDKSREILEQVDEDDDGEDDDDEQNVMVKEEEIDEIQVAGPDIPIIALELEQPLDKFDTRILIQKCLKETAPTCIYCNHARKIAVNGKQLGLHLVAEHRYSAIVHSITAEELIPESFVARIKETLQVLDETFFSLDAGPSDEAVTFSHVFECFQCRYATTVHKELYLHNRKSHAKNLLLCIMCKSNFYSYSELICHLCPGVYVLDSDAQFRCCMCVCDDIPSAFRLMVHLRKRHHVCDVCLEMCHNQYKLSNHVWKHKLHHFCYRCGIAYRNKPDITRHLFWKHGTESVVCKKCLQKKWPHVYHFCVPPATFQCEECGVNFSRAVSLKVHKRIHADDRPHACTFENCHDKFVSKKLLAKHESRHRDPPEPVEPPPPPSDSKRDVDGGEATVAEDVRQSGNELHDPPDDRPEQQGVAEEKEKKKIDVYDLPALNLSESDSSSDSEGETKSKSIEEIIETDQSHDLEISLNLDPIEVQIIHSDDKLDGDDDDDDDEQMVPDNIWDDFKNYQATKEKFDYLLESNEKSQNPEASTSQQSKDDNRIEESDVLTLEKALMDHDYCVDPNNKPDISYTEVEPDLSQSVDHDYCSTSATTATTPTITAMTKKEQRAANGSKRQQIEKTDAKKTSNSSSSGSSSDSDSSSCSCGPNCSCSSSSSSDSSTSDSSNSDSSTEEGRKKQQIRRDRRRLKKNTKGGSASAVPTKVGNAVVDVTTVDNNSAAAATAAVVMMKDAPIEESDLETTESETDEEFYDRQPQQFARKMLEEKRNQVLAGIESAAPNNGPVFAGGENCVNRTGTPNNLPDEVEAQVGQLEVKKKKSKSKKKKKKKKAASGSKDYENPRYYNNQPPITLTLSRRSSPTVQLTNKIPKIEQRCNIMNATAAVAGGSNRGDDSIGADGSLRASKRRRVPNKFYGYSSDEEGESGCSSAKWRPQQQIQNFVVPPITIKAVPSPVSTTASSSPKVQPFSIRTAQGQMRVQPPQQSHVSQHQQQQQRRMPPIRLKPPKTRLPPAQTDSSSLMSGGGESEDDSSDNEGRNLMQVNRDALYCYCKCPYDEVSEMIGCDSRDCEIEWFHFECVGIMVPPKGHWYCPECRKKRQQKRDLLKIKLKTTNIV